MRLKGYIDVMMLLAHRTTHNTYTLEESTKNLGESLERKKTLQEKLREMYGEEVARVLADTLQRANAKVKESEGKLRERETQLKDTLKISEECECMLKDKVSRLKDTENTLKALQEDLSLKQDESTRVLGESLKRERALEDALRESESKLVMTQEKLMNSVKMSTVRFYFIFMCNIYLIIYNI
eukprot:GHVR01061613.1.p1 GENE.GHVR01061613.1~~GHVR01061613.1.p1  ORF type:complete len:183 (+),score=30.35 GHVR01061613.1:165-713(+)